MTTIQTIETTTPAADGGQLDQIDQLLVGLGISAHGTVTGRSSSSAPLQGNTPKSASIEKQP